MGVDGSLTPDRARQRWWLAAAAATWALLSLRLAHFVGRHSVNVLYFDQWDFWEGLFRGDGPWALFRWQHGPVRQGLGGLVIAASARASGWDVRVECFVTAGIVAAAAVLALLLARALRGSWSLADACIPFVFLTLSLYELFVVTPNPAHGALPLLLVTGYALALQIERAAVRVPVLVVLAFLATYTGFGFFLGPVSVLVLALDLTRAARERRQVALHALGLTVCALAVASFFSGYVFAPASECFRFPDPHPLGYLAYLNLLFIRVLELQVVKPLRMGLGLPIPLAAAALVAWSGWRAAASLGRSRLHLTIFALGAFSWLFAANAAIGRVCLGAGQAASSRYVPYLIPMLLAAYLFLSIDAGGRWKRALLGVFAILCVGKEIWGPAASRTWVDHYEGGKRRWVACYLRMEDVARCNDEAHFLIYPDEASTPRLERDLAFLRARKLNLFKP